MARRVLLVCLLALLVPAAGASARPRVGIGEQDPAMFSDAHYTRLHVRDVRLVVSWDVLWVPWERAQVDAYVKAAHKARARVLVTFAHSRVEGHEDEIPGRRTWRRLFSKFRHRYPSVHDFQAWNEGNHGSQPTSRHPRKAARVYDTMRSACRRCRISAPSVLDASNMLSWIRRFRRATHHRVRIWSLHNYIDANRGRSIGTRKLLRHVSGRVWFTETGGIANRWVHGRRVHGYTLHNAARATRRVFRLARLSHRVKRIYFYNWTPPEEHHPRWDSALLSASGKPRPAYRVLRRKLAKRHR